MIFRNLIRTLQSGWRWVAIFTLLGLVFALIISIQTTPQYFSTASFLIYPNNSLVSSRDVVTSLNTLGTETVSKTYLEIFNSRRVFLDTVTRLGLDPAILQNYRVEAVVTTGANIELSVSGPDPVMASFLANNIGQNGINYIKSIYQVFDIAFLDQASQPTRPYAPQTLRDGLIASLAGLLFGLGFIFARDSLRAPLEALRRRAMSENQSGAFILRHFRNMLDREIARHASEPAALALIELDGLEDLMDVLPERALSDLLHDVVRTLRNQLRGSDVVGRWNKSSFIILMPFTPGAGAERTLLRIKQSLDAPFAVNSYRESIRLVPLIGWAERTAGETGPAFEARTVSALELARLSPEHIAAAPNAGAGQLGAQQERDT